MHPDIVAIARGWLGTPYRHQAWLKGVGCDCLGLVRGVYAEAYGRPAEMPPPYSRDWAEAARRETLIEAAERHLEPIDPPTVGPGDILIFRLRPGAMAKHCGIVSEATSGVPVRMMHAVEGAAVCEVNLSPWWRRRVAAAFRFPRAAEIQPESEVPL
jgi:NlpC/P60 family putative phage cell wall peptidase